MSEWISVEDRLPGAYTSVLLAFKDLVFITVGFWNGHYWDPDREDLSNVPVTHWMPLPDPPEVAK